MLQEKLKNVTYMYTKVEMRLKYLHYDTMTLHRFEIDLICRDQVVHFPVGFSRTM